MSLILKNNLAFPLFRHQETLTFHKSDPPKRSQKRYNTINHIRRLAPQGSRIFNMTNQTHEITCETQNSPKQTQKTQLTSRPSKNESEQLQEYLNHLNTVRSLKSPSHLKRFASECQIQTPDIHLNNNSSVQRFKNLKETNEKRKKVSLLLTVRNPHAQQYKKFTEQIYNLIHNLHQLQEYVNNSRKLYQVVKHLIGQRQNLHKILIKQQQEELVSFSDISRLCCITETIYVNGEQRVIEKFDLSLIDDLIYMTDAIKQLLLQNQLMSIRRIIDNIQTEQNEITKLRESMGMRHQEQILSSSSIAMQRFKPHLELNSIEQKLGQLNQIPKQARWTSQILCEIVEILNDKKE